MPNVSIGQRIIELQVVDVERSIRKRIALIRVVVLGFALCAALWWTYFGGDDELGEKALTAAAPDRRVRLAILAYSYVHLGMLMGIVAIAAGLHDAIAKLAQPGFDATPYLAQEAVSDADALGPIRI